jgi:NTE family protein
MAGAGGEDSGGAFSESRIAGVRSCFAAAPLFRGLPAAAAAAFFEEMSWFSLPGGSILFRQGEQGEALYLVVSGRLVILAEDPGGEPVLVAEAGVGETVGEMALISGAPRSATVMALRDSELLEITRRDFERILERHPGVALPLARDLAARLSQRLRHDAPGGAARNFALLPLAPGLPLESLGRDLAAALAAHAPRARILGPADGGHESEWFTALEQASDFCVYCAEPEITPWTRLCLRQADRILLVCRPDQPAPPVLLHQLAPAEVGHRPLDLVLLEPAQGPLPAPCAAWLSRIPAKFHCRVRPGIAGDTARLARFLLGCAMGLVLSGGGARGLAHIGVIRALREAGIALDLVAGTSMGAIIAAGVALEWSDEELSARVRHSFVDTNPLSDLALPFIAFTRGRKVSRLLHAQFGEVQVEDLWRPYFCTSSNLTTARSVVHRDGPLWLALRASVAIPGLLPPVIERGEVLVDGGVMDNFPIDLMHGQHRGPVIGVNVGATQGLASAVDDLENVPLWRLLLKGRRNVPWIIPVLVRAGTISSNVQNELARRQADLLLVPPLEEIDILDWKAFDRAVEIGYRYASERLAETPLKL